MVNSEFASLELEVKSKGYKDAEDFIRKNKSHLSEDNIKMLQIIGFRFD